MSRKSDWRLSDFKYELLRVVPNSIFVLNLRREIPCGRLAAWVLSGLCLVSCLNASEGRLVLDVRETSRRAEVPVLGAVVIALDELESWIGGLQKNGTSPFFVVHDGISCDRGPSPDPAEAKEVARLRTDREYLRETRGTVPPPLRLRRKLGLSFDGAHWETFAVADDLLSVKAAWPNADHHALENLQSWWAALEPPQRAKATILVPASESSKSQMSEQIGTALAHELLNESAQVAIYAPKGEGSPLELARLRAAGSTRPAVESPCPPCDELRKQKSSQTLTPSDVVRANR